MQCYYYCLLRNSNVPPDGIKLDDDREMMSEEASGNSTIRNVDKFSDAFWQEVVPPERSKELLACKYAVRPVSNLSGDEIGELVNTIQEMIKDEVKESHSFEFIFVCA